MRFAHHLALICCKTIASLMVATTLAGAVSATTFISNLNGNDLSSTTLVGELNGSKALGFGVGGYPTYQLDSVVLRLDVGDTSMTIGAALYGRHTVLPPSGSPLVTFSIPAFSSTGIQNYTLLPDALFLLHTYTNYFLVVYGVSPGSSHSYINWMASSPDETPTGWAFNDAFADTSGLVILPPTTPSSVINSFAINATVYTTPEPATLGITVVTILGLIAGRRRLRAGCW